MGARHLQADHQDASLDAALLSGDVDLISSVPGNDLAKVNANRELGLPRCRATGATSGRRRRPRRSPLVTDNDGKPMAKNPLKDVRVRRALSKALDRDALVSRVMQAQGVLRVAVHARRRARHQRHIEAGSVGF